MSDCTITLGCIMAEVVEMDNGEITVASSGDVKLIFCLTSTSEKDTIIVTPAMRQLGDLSFFPIAVAQVDLSCGTQFILRAFSGLSSHLLTTLEQQWPDLVQTGLGLTPGQLVSAVSA